MTSYVPRLERKGPDRPVDEVIRRKLSSWTGSPKQLISLLTMLLFDYEAIQSGLITKAKMKMKVIPSRKTRPALRTRFCLLGMRMKRAICVPL